MGVLKLRYGVKQSSLRKQIFQRTIRHELLTDIPYAVYARSFNVLECDSE